jgi:hypothetical protein
MNSANKITGANAGGHVGCHCMWAPASLSSGVSCAIEVPLSLRMNLYGWESGNSSKSSGSKDSAVLERATADL